MFTRASNWYLTRLSDDRGAQMVEYGFLVLLIALIVIAAVTLMGERLNELFYIRAVDCLLNASPPC